MNCSLELVTRLIRLKYFTNLTHKLWYIKRTVQFYGRLIFYSWYHYSMGSCNYKVALTFMVWTLLQSEGRFFTFVAALLNTWTCNICRSVQKCIKDIIQSRRAIHQMNTQYPDVTEEQLAAGDNVCIICREEMVTVVGE